MQELSTVLHTPDSDSPPTAIDDSSLVTATRGDPTAFAALYRRYVASIYRYLYSRVGGDADAQDLTAQVFLEALEGLPRYRERGNFAAWLFTIARRRAADHHRQRSTLPLDNTTDPSTDQDPLSDVVQREALERLRILVAQLEDDQRELLRLRFAAGLSFSQMAAALGRSEAAVKMAVYRLLERLKAGWEKEG